MIIRELINEKHYSGPLYHSTGYGQFVDILNQGIFKVNHTQGMERSIRSHPAMFGTDDKSMQRVSKLYYFSASRDKLNTFRKDTGMVATFVLNTDYL